MIVAVFVEEFNYESKTSHAEHKSSLQDEND